MANGSANVDKAKDEAATRTVFRWVAVGLAVLAALRLVGVLPGEKDVAPLYLFGLALAALAFPEVTKFSIGRDGLSLERRLSEIDAKVDNVQASTKELSSAVNVGIGGASTTPAIKPHEARSTLELAAADAVPAHRPSDSDDPNLGMFGRKQVENARKLDAHVRRSALREDWFTIDLTVESTDPNRALHGTVEFHLHPTFRENPAVRPVVNGRARLDLVAWGAFTVGAVVTEADGTETKLELNLAGLPDAPAEFKAR